MRTNKPECPNHHIPLIALDMKNGIGQCPDSGCFFRFSIEIFESTKKIARVNGEYVEQGDWGVKQINGSGG